MQQIHYIIIGIVIATIVIFQVWVYLKTRKKINVFRGIFPDNPDSYSLKEEKIAEIQSANDAKLRSLLKNIGKDVEMYFDNAKSFNSQKAIRDLIAAYDDREIIVVHNNSVLKEILSSINKYLVKNKGAISDFHLMKDIVDRNCDAKEEEINTQIPVPLYLGLMGTMAGILVGIGFLVFTGGLDALLSSTEWAEKGIRGVNTLMGGVALAMISSILGIFLTTLGSNRIKNAKKNVDKNKNTFLSWMQSELLPNLQGDISSAFVQLAQNLTNFNSVFSENTNDLKMILENVNESYQNQTELLKAVNDLKVKDIATANIEIYNKLKSFIDEIGVLGGYLENVKEYVETVHQSIAKTGTYFSREIEQIEERKGVITKAVAKIDDELHVLVSSIKKNAENQIEDLKKSTVRQTEALKQAIEQQQDALNKKLQETSVILSELKNLTALRTIMDNLVQATNSQNQKLDYLTQAISELVEVKGGTGASWFFIPKWTKILLIAGFSVISLSCLIYLVKEFLNVIW